MKRKSLKQYSNESIMVLVPITTKMNDECQIVHYISGHDQNTNYKNKLTHSMCGFHRNRDSGNFIDSMIIKHF